MSDTLRQTLQPHGKFVSRVVPIPYGMSGVTEGTVTLTPRRPLQDLEAHLAVRIGDRRTLNILNNQPILLDGYQPSRLTLHLTTEGEELQPIRANDATLLAGFKITFRSGNPYHKAQEVDLDDLDLGRMDRKLIAYLCSEAEQTIRAQGGNR